MKINVNAKVSIEVQYKDVLAFLQEEKLSPEQHDNIIQECLRRKKGFFTLPDQQKFEIFEQYKDTMSPEEMEKRFTSQTNK